MDENQAFGKSPSAWTPQTRNNGCDTVGRDPMDGRVCFPSSWNADFFMPVHADL